MSGPRGLVAFDLDGTLLRGLTVCELIAGPLGRAAEMRRFESLRSQPEIADARAEMARWYAGRSPAALCAPLADACWAPGAREGIALLQAHGIEVALASITWAFAVDWFAARLGVRRALGTGRRSGGVVEHVWPRDKAAWLREQATELRVPARRVAAVGDSASDADLLAAAELRIFVGPAQPTHPHAVWHRPAGAIDAIAREIIACWA